MADVRANLMRLATLALASSAALAVGASAGVAAATTHSKSTTSTSNRNAVPATLSGIKAQASADITKRLNSLNAASARANRAKNLGSGQATLASHLGADIAPLQQLNQKIQGDTTTQQAAQDYASIFLGFRVYRLVLPASKIAGDADRDTATAIPQLSADVTKARSYVTTSNQAQLQPLIDDLTNNISTVNNATNGLTATVLAYTPAQLNANGNLLNTATSSDRTARDALKKARSDLKQIRRILKGEGTTATGLRGAGLSGSGHHKHHGHASGTTTTTGAPASTS